MTRAATADGVAVLGARPNFVKLLPLVTAFRRDHGLTLPWIHTGQHESPAMDEAMRRDLGLPSPSVRLRATAPGPSRQVSMARALIKVLEARPPGWVLVFGDVDSTAAAALAARKLRRPLVHVEAGLRAHDPSMAEERNRILADHLAARLYVTEPGAVQNLLGEGIAAARIRSPGNVMADALHQMRDRIDRRARRLLRGALATPYAVVTLHRQANVDSAPRLRAWIRAIGELGRTVPVLWPIHPRLVRAVGATARRELVASGVRLMAPQPYLDFLALVSGARLVATDSGGLQVETALLGIPCLTLRDRTEHQITVGLWSHVLLGQDPKGLRQAAVQLLGRRPRLGSPPRAWDGRAGERIALDLVHRPPLRAIGKVHLPAGHRLPVGF